jgi:hypothetical protein
VSDRRLFEAAEEIALDRTASPQARVFAISALIAAVRDGFFSEYEQLVGGYGPEGHVAGGCWTAVSGRFLAQGTPLPPDARERAISIRQKLLADQTEPRDVRTAATCLLPRRAVWAQD